MEKSRCDIAPAAEQEPVAAGGYCLQQIIVPTAHAGQHQRAAPGPAYSRNIGVRDILPVAGKAADDNPDHRRHTVSSASIM